MGRGKMVLLLWILRAAVFLSAVDGIRVPAKSPMASPLASGMRNGIPAAAPSKEISGYSAKNNSHLESPSPATSHAPQEVGNSANTTYIPWTSPPASSPSIRPAQNETWNPLNSKHVPPASQPHSPSVISPASQELENPSNAAPSPLLHPIDSPSISPSRNEVRIPSNNAHAPLPSQPGSTSVASPAPNEIRNPSNNAHASPPSLPGSSSAITPASNELKDPSNTVPSPLFLHLAPSPVTYPSPHEVRNPSSNAPSPSTSHPASFPVTSPAPHKNNPHNYINTPVTLHPSSSPAVSPVPHDTDNPPTGSFAPSTLHPRPSPITSPVPNKTLPNTIYAPATSHPDSYPVISPAPHEIKKPPNTTPAPTSHFPLICPTSHEVNSPPSYGKAPTAPLQVCSPDISPAPQDTKNSSSSPHTLPTSSPGLSPTVSPATYTSPSNTAHSPATSHLGSYSVISPSTHEVKSPSNPIRVPSTSHTNLSPVISPTPHEVNTPLNHTGAHVTSHPRPSTVLSPTLHNFKILPNSTHTPLISHPPISPVISPTPDKTLSNITHVPVTSVTSPVANGIKNPSNTTSAPLASHPSQPPVISPTDKVTNSTSMIPTYPTSQPNPSPVMSPAPNIIRNPAMFNHSSLGSHEYLSPESGPVSYRVRNPSSSAHAPSTSYSSHVPALSPEPQKVNNPPKTSHSEYPSTIQSPLSAPKILTHQHTAKQRMNNPAAAPLSPLLPPSYYPVDGPVITSTSSRKRHHPPPLFVEGPIHAPAQSPVSRKPEAPSPKPIWRLPSPPPNYGPIHAPAQSPVSRKPEAPSPKPIWRLPSPPPNYDCNSLICPDTLANSPPGSPCDCVLPIKVQLRVGVALYNFFPLVSEFAREIAAGTFIKQSQVRITGANAASEQTDKTIVFIDLVPSGKFFDNASAYIIYEKFWHKQVVIDALFGDYDVLYVLYPGLPPSPPSSPSGMNVDEGAYGNNNNGRAIRPLAVDVRKQKKKHGGSLIAIIVLSSVICLAFVLGAAWLFVLKYRDHAHQPAQQVSLPTFSKPSGAGVAILRSGPSSKTASFSSSIATYTGSAKTYTLAEMEKATNRFDDSRIIGEGGFGRVYQGTLEDGTEAAVKVLKREDQQGGREFLAEVEMLSRLHHRNLVKLIGICTEDIPCLVYELIPNGSVESHLHGVDKETYPLDWSARVKIALGAARGLAYLHEDSSPCVIHRDFKSSNILLEHDFTPKVSDFGLARTAVNGGEEHISTRVMGTFGYVAPEYAMTGHLLVKSDVYSYGVVLLELLTGRKPVDMLQPPGQENLVAWARPLLADGDGLERIIDPALGGDVPFDSVAKVAAIASMCVQSEVSHRPFMGEVVQALKLVCDENDVCRPSVSCSQEEFSVQETDIRINTGLSLEAEKVLSASDVFSTSARFSREASDSFRRHSSSGPLRTGKSRQNIRSLSAGSVSEHGVALRFGTGFERDEQWS